MNIDQLRKEIEIDEGKKDYIYLDHLGYPTFGIGHLITREDPEYNKPVNTYISEERIIEAFNEDISIVLKNCERLYPDFYDLPEEAQLIIANMMFNLGYSGLAAFKNMKKAVDERNWLKASYEMMNSKWYNQVNNRAQRLVNRIRSIK